MPSPDTKIKTEAPDNTSFSSSGMFKGRVTFSRIQLVSFAAMFALIGGYVLFRSFAASPPVATLEAEQMTLPPGGSVFTDATASAGKAIKLLSNGTATGSVSFPGTVTSFTVLAKADVCSGNPSMSVSVDGTAYINATAVSSTVWASYSANVNLGSGNHSLSIKFSNDYYRRHHCDRNLYVDVTNFYGPVAPATPPPTISLSASPGSVTAGSAATLTWNATNADTCTGSGAWSGDEGTSGSKTTGALNSNSTYNLLCTGPGGQATFSASVSVTQPSSGGAMYYVNPSGSDSNAGSQTAPWKTVAKACASVTADQAGTISLATGTYSETATCSLPCLVNLEGAGPTATIIKGSDDPLIKLVNCPASTNKQTVSGFKLDGQSRTAGTIGMSVNNVYGLTITNIDSENFKGTPVPTSGGGTLNISNATNLDLGNSTFRNGGDVQSGQCTGTIGLGNIYNSNIHDLTISEDTGYAIKDSVAPSTVSDTNLYNLNVSVGTTDCSQWNTIAIEFFSTTATNDQIYNSNFNGPLSLTGPDTNTDIGNPKTNGDVYRWRVHNNHWTIATGSFYAIEASNNSMEIDHNYVSGGIYPFSYFESYTLHDDWIHNNVIDNIQNPAAFSLFGSGLVGTVFEDNTVVLRMAYQDGVFDFSDLGSDNSAIGNIFDATSSVGDQLKETTISLDHNSFWNLTAKGTNTITTNPSLPLSGGFPAAYTPPAGNASAGLGAFADGSFAVGVQ